MGFWGAVKKAINNNLNLPLNELIMEHGTQTFTASGTFIVPDGVTKILVTAAGGGGGGAGGGKNINDDDVSGGGGGGGACILKQPFIVTPGQEIPIAIGSGGSAGKYSLGTNSFSQPGKGGSTVVGDLITLAGGSGAISGRYVSRGGKGGVGGGGGGSGVSGTNSSAQCGGVGYENGQSVLHNGSNHGGRGLVGNGGEGVLINTVYKDVDPVHSSNSGGGGGGSYGAGGAGGIGYNNVSGYTGGATSGSAGSYGGGGGGGGGRTNTSGGKGGSGIVIIEW